MAANILIALFLAVLTVELFLYVKHRGEWKQMCCALLSVSIFLLGGVFAFLYALVG